jgi:hypothetical protein
VATTTRTNAYDEGRKKKEEKEASGETHLPLTQKTHIKHAKHSRKQKQT